MKFKSDDLNPTRLKKRVAAALSAEPAQLVIRGADWLDVFAGCFHRSDVAITDGVIVGTGEPYEGHEVLDASGLFLVPGFVDAHVHIESSLVTPARFQQAVLPLGTTTALWDPHEIANVRGTAGVEWALHEALQLEMDVFVLLPSCVPASHLETSGARLDASDLIPFASHPRVLGLAEFMNVPGVLHGDPGCVDKLVAFAKGPRDGHAPEVRGKDLNAYLCAGIQGCHESTTAEEAQEKLAKGMHVLVREGSCAKDAEALLPIVNAYTSAVVGFCSDDRNPLDISREGHISHIVDLALRRGLSPESVFRCASFAAAQAYGLKDRGVVAPGYLADLCAVRQRKPGDWTQGCEVVFVVKKGKCIEARALEKWADAHEVRAREGAFARFIHQRNMRMPVTSPESLAIAGGAPNDRCRVRVIQIHQGQLLTDCVVAEVSCDERGHAQADPSRDILKLLVCERHHATGNIGKGFVRGFGISSGAIATTIGHDSHNVTAVGSSDRALAGAIAALQNQDGGIVVTDENGHLLASLVLPIGGLMTAAPLLEVTGGLTSLKKAAADIGCTLDEPFLQLSFLSLPVIPSLKLTDRGLVDVERFEHVSVFV